MILISLSILVLITISFGQLPESTNHSCYRECKGSLIRTVCEFEFNIENFFTLTNACAKCPQNSEDCHRHDCVSGDGAKRFVQVVNRKMPGPKIEVCEGDEVIVKVRNKMQEASTSIHWHGQLQKGTQFMDGVPFVTQCPIYPNAVFTYRFKAETGTHFWHSHIGQQRGNGIIGPLIVRRNISSERKLYDFDLSEHIIVIQDWTESAANDVFIKRYFGDNFEYSRSLLINGLGRYISQGGSQNVPAARFVVESDSRYRFRIIQSAFMTICVVFSIDGHNFSVIASDGADIRPVTVDSLNMFSGERYDIVVTANQTAGLYWMRFVGLLMGKFNQAHQAAVLQYSTASSVDYPIDAPTWTDNGQYINQINGLYKSLTNMIRINELRAVKNVNVRGRAHKLYITIDYRDKVHPRFDLSKPSPKEVFFNKIGFPVFGNISLRLFSFPLLSQKDQIIEKLYCDENNIEDDCRNELCICPHIIKLKLDTLVELVLIDKGNTGDIFHPFHLHGHSFQVIGSDRLGNTTTIAYIQYLDQQGLLKRNFVNPPTKDTVQVPDGGYTIIRFIADNPGFWLFHCHLDFHMELGMGLVFQVGERSEMPSAPKGFPKCGDYTNPPAPPQ